MIEILILVGLAICVLGFVVSMGRSAPGSRLCANAICGHSALRHKTVDASCTSSRVTNAAGIIVKSDCSCERFVEPEKDVQA